MTNVVWLGSHADKGHYGRLKEKLSTLHISLTCSDDFLQPGSDFQSQIKMALSSAEFIVVFVSGSAVQSDFLLEEIENALVMAEDRNKIILPIIQWGTPTLDKIIWKIKQYSFATGEISVCRPRRWFTFRKRLQSSSSKNR